MKTSNIIIIAFAVFILGSTIFLFADSKNHKNHKNETRTDAVLKSSPLQDFSVVVAEESSDIHLNQATTNSIAVEFLKDKTVKKQMYKLQNDTLYVYGGLRTFVDCKNVKSIIVNKAFWVGLNGFNQDSLNLNAKGGRIVFESNDVKMNIGSMQLNVSDTESVEMYNNVAVDDMFVNATDKANLSFLGVYKSADVKIKNMTQLTFNNAPLKLKLDRDESCKVNIYQ